MFAKSMNMFYNINVKRTGFKKPTFEEAVTRLKAKPKKLLSRKVKKPKKKPVNVRIKRLKGILWELCKQIIRLKYQNPDGTWYCYTCGKLIDIPAKAQTGHFLASSVCGAYLRHDLRNLRIQDYYCNINLGGSGAIFYQKLVEREGQEYVNQIFQDKQKTIKADEIWYESKIKEYQEVLLRMQAPMF